MARAASSPLIKEQVEKLLAAAGGIHGGGGGGRRPTSSSSPIIIPRKPPRSNASSHSSSSYTSVADQLSFFGDSSVPTDDVSMPALPSACQQLEHSAARDRISVKNKRRQPLKQKLSTLREADDNDGDLFASKFDDNDDDDNIDDIILSSLPLKRSYKFNQIFSSPSTTAISPATHKLQIKLNNILHAFAYD